MEEMNYYELSVTNGGSELSDFFCKVWGVMRGVEWGKYIYASQGGNLAAVIAYK